MAPANHNHQRRRPNRRDFVYALLMAVSCSSATAEETELLDEQKSMNNDGLLLCSPKDGAVKEVLIKDGAKVKSGQVICTIEPDDETHALERLAAFEQLVEIEAKQLAPDTVSLRRRSLEANEKIAIAYHGYALQKRDIEKDKHQVFGIVSELVVAQAEAALQKASGEKEKASQQIELFNFTISQAQQRITIIKQQIAKERDFIKSRLQRLQIKCPGAGEVKLLVGKDSFVKLGKPLARLTIR